MSASSLCDPQPSTSTGRVSSSTIKVGPPSISNGGTGSQSAAVNILTCNQSLDEDEQKDIEKLQTIFPDKDESYLSDIRRNNITLNHTIDDILGIEALEGWFLDKVNVLIEPCSWYSPRRYHAVLLNKFVLNN